MHRNVTFYLQLYKFEKVLESLRFGTASHCFHWHFPCQWVNTDIGHTINNIILNLYNSSK